MGCAGTLLDGLGERSVEPGFAQVSVHIDPRTSSPRLFDAAETVLSPLLVIGTVLGVLFVATRLQMRLGGASMLTVQPPTRLDADALDHANPHPVRDECMPGLVVGQASASW